MIRLGLVGVGKIARDQHVPTIRRSGKFELAAIASPNMFYVNTMLDRLKASEPRLLNRLF